MPFCWHVMASTSTTIVLEFWDVCFVSLSFDFHLHAFLWINFRPHVYSCFIVDAKLFPFVGTVRSKNFGQHVVHFYLCCNSIFSMNYSYMQMSNKVPVNMLGKIR